MNFGPFKSENKDSWIAGLLYLEVILSNPGTSLVPGFDKIAYTAAGVKPRNVLLQKSENLCSYKTGFPNIF